MEKKKMDTDLRIFKGNGANGAHFGDDKNQTYILWLEGKNPFTFIHELMHVTHKAMQIVGIRLSDSTEEIYAYYIEFLYEECSNFLNTIK